jgi:hypothetical protein
MPSSARTAGRQTRSIRTALTLALAVLALGTVGQAHGTPSAGGHRNVVVVADGGPANPGMVCSLC